MLALLRNITHRPSTSVSKSLPVKYSTGPSIWRSISEVLEEVSEEQQAPTPSSTNFSGSAGTRHRKPTKWKPFMPNTVIRPHELTYQSRLVVPPPPRRRAVVGPPPNVARYTDVFHQFGIDPLSQAQNPEVLASFLSEMGKIYSRSVTGLTMRSQRRLGKAIRRAKMMGVIPVLSKPRAIYSSHSKR